MGDGSDGLESSLPTQMILRLRLDKTTKVILSNPYPTTTTMPTKLYGRLGRLWS